MNAIRLFSLRMAKLRSVMQDRKLRTALLRYAVLAGVEHKDILERVGFTPEVVLDVGANRGQFSLAVRSIFPEAKLVAFEPLPRAASVYRSVFANDNLTTLHEAALGASRGRIKIYVTAADDSSSALMPSQLQKSLFPGSSVQEEVEVRVHVLSDFADQLGSSCLLKIDVQGFEKSVLEGSVDCLHRINAVYVECSFVELYSGQAVAGDVIGFLARRGFSLRGVHNSHCDRAGFVLQADLLFCRDGQDGASALTL